MHFLNEHNTYEPRREKNMSSPQWRSQNADKVYAHQRETTGLSSDSLHLRPFLDWNFSSRKEFAPRTERILSLNSSSLWYGKSLLPH